MLGLLLGLRGGTFFAPISPESDFFMAVVEIKAQSWIKKTPRYDNAVNLKAILTVFLF